MTESLKLKEATLKETQVHSKDFHGALKNIFRQFADELSQRDIDGFLSKFKYNKHGFTRGDRISSIVYE